MPSIGRTQGECQEGRRVHKARMASDDAGESHGVACRVNELFFFLNMLHAYDY